MKFKATPTFAKAFKRLRKKHRISQESVNSIRTHARFSHRPEFIGGYANAGILDRWIVGSLDCWIIGLLD